YSSVASGSSSLKLVAELRKRTTVGVQKAREALMATNDDVEGALQWLEKDRVSSGQRTAEKVGSRFAGEGLIGVAVLSRGSCHGPPLGIRAAMVELNCETDFVGRNELFRKLSQDLAFTAAFMAEPPPSLSPANEPHPFIRPIELAHLQGAPLMIRDGASKHPSVSDAIRDIIAAVGENIKIRRAVSFVHNSIPPPLGMGLRVACYVHGALAIPPGNPSAVMEAQGRIGALVAVGLRTSPASRLSELLAKPAFDVDLGALERGIARQVVGMRPERVHGDRGNNLYSQPFDMLASSGGQTVQKTLKSWGEEQKLTDENPLEDGMTGLSVVEFLRWEVGE
ncbi:elongation factor TS-domain-containing protein, partial [Gautieria morchelliformis]